MQILLAALACTDPASETGGHASDTDEDTAVDTALPPTATVDVLVIGSGPAGAAAAWQARELGASVLVLEREDRAGGAGWYAGNFFAVDTRWQQKQGITDSVEQAAEDWEALTGGDPDDPWVELLFERSEEVLAWFLDELGARFTGFVEGASDETPRLHKVWLPDASLGPVSLLTAEIEDLLLLEHQAEALVLGGEEVIGASYSDLAGGEEGWIAAEAVVVATGGFVRDTERVLEARPELAGLDLHVEAAHTSDGGGAGLLADLEVQEHNPHQVGVYVHGLSDPRDGFDGEVLWPAPPAKQTLIVDLAGERVADEGRTTGFDMIEVLLAAPDQRLVSLMPDSLYQELQLLVPAYNREVETERETVDPEKLAGLLSHAAASEVAEAWGMDEDTLSATVARYDELAAAGEDADFGKEPAWLVAFGEEPIQSMELVAGAAKSFGGVALDTSARVLAADGEPIPGLYAAGEVAGMLGTAAIGRGLDGAVTACYLSGLVAGQSAAEGR